MAGAPDLAAGFLILHGAIQVRANGGESFPIGFVDPDQQGGFVSELDDFAGIRLQLLDAAGDYLIDGGFGDARRIEIANDGIEKRSQRCRHAAAEQPGHGRSPGFAGGSFRGGNSGLAVGAVPVRGASVLFHDCRVGMWASISQGRRRKAVMPIESVSYGRSRGGWRSPLYDILLSEKRPV